MTYYDDLIKDEKRVTVFKEIILHKAYGVTYDLGTGSGILASFASKNAEKVYALEINPLVIKKYTTKFLKNYDNIEIIESDASTYEFKEKADVIICEMLDTALIDEEQVPVINNAIKYSKENTIFIPKSTYDTIQVGTAKISYVTYQEFGNRIFNSLSSEIKYNEVDFSKEINPNFEKDIKITIQKSGILNSLLITTYTCLDENLITEPTPMLNPPLLIPINEVSVSKGDIIIINLKYTMGGGLNTIRANTKRII